MFPFGTNPSNLLVGFPWTIFPSQQDWSARHKELVGELKKIYLQAFRGPGGDARAFLPGGKADEILREERGKEIVKKLYSNYEGYRRDANIGGEPASSPEIFWKWLLGGDLAEPEEKDSRAKLFAVLILSDVRLTSCAWTKFVEGVLRGNNDSDQRLCDGLMRFKPSPTIRRWFGDGEDSDRLTGLISLNQHWICPYIINGDEEPAPAEAREPCVSERPRKIDSEGWGIYEIKLDLESCRGVFPCGWIARKDLRRDEEAEAEIGAYRRLRALLERGHPHILEVYATVIYWNKISIYMSLVSGSLREYMEQNCPPTNVDDKIEFFGKLLGLARALVYLHEQAKIRHGDVQASNVLVRIDADGNLTFLISDFGVSTRVEKTNGSPIRYTEQGAHSPPEGMQNLINASSPDLKGDVWSLACLACTILVWMEGGWAGCKRFFGARDSSSNGRLELSPNVWFFTAGLDQARSPQTEMPAQASSQRETRDYHTWKRTQNQWEPVVVTANHAVIDYFESIYCPQVRDEDRGREKSFIQAAFKTILESALVPNPAARDSMADFYSKLQELMSHHSMP